MNENNFFENINNEKEPNHIIIDMSEWKTVSSPSILETEGLGVCVGILI